MKLTKRILDYATSFYLNNHSIKETRKGIYDKYRVLVSCAAIQKRFKLLKVSIRSREEISNLFLKRKFSEEKINKIKRMYMDNKYSIRKISKKTGITRSVIKRVLIDFGIILRENYEALLLTNSKHKKYSFSQDEEEKAYLIGLVEGDVHVRKKSKFTLRLTSTSTHRDFILLLKNSFDKYSPVYIYPTRDKDNYKWNISIEVELKTFSFLLKDQRRQYINHLKVDIFFQFLAGFIDSDGSVYPKKAGKYTQCVIRIFSENVDLLRKIKLVLEQLNYTPNLGINTKKGESRGLSYYNNNYFVIELCRKNEVMKLLKILSLKHPEKIKRKKIMLGLENKIIRHTDLIEIDKLRSEIKLDVNKYISEAENEYRLRKTIPLDNP